MQIEPGLAWAGFEKLVSRTSLFIIH